MIVSPSVLSLDYAKFAEQLKEVNECCEWVHFDVMDGNFVPNITFGPKIFSDFRKNSDLFMDVHLMVTNPEYFSDVFADNGADGITFHYESFNDLEKCDKLIDKIHSKYIKAGISIRPKTPVEVIKPLLNKLDLVLIMSVEPGFGGQEFMPETLEKIKELDRIRKENNYKFLIQDDGGVNSNTAFDILHAGCDVLVAGSFVFKGDIKNNVEMLRKCEG